MSSTEDRGASEPESWNEWERVQSEPDFTELKRRLRVFVFPMTGLFLVWYLLYVLLADYAHGFMSTKVVGN
ncbi:clumping factor B, partial [Amycolatopsis antarctica]